MLSTAILTSSLFGIFFEVPCVERGAPRATSGPSRPRKHSATCWCPDSPTHHPESLELNETEIYAPSSTHPLSTCLMVNPLNPKATCARLFVTGDHVAENVARVTFGSIKHVKNGCVERWCPGSPAHHPRQRPQHIHF